MSDARQFAPATERNRDPILAVLQKLDLKGKTVLEIASGSGEHATYLAPALEVAAWLPSDIDTEARASIEAWTAHLGAEQVAPPFALDVTSSPWPVEERLASGVIRVDAIVCINMIHIAPPEATDGLMAGAGRMLEAGGVLYLYGPFKFGGRHTAPSNQDFDAWLKEKNPEFGIRDIGDVSAVAERNGLVLEEAVSMPANNFSLIYRKPEE